MAASVSNVDPAKQAAPKLWSALGHSSTCKEPCCYIIGPGGKNSLTENNEKGMLDQVVLDVMATTVGGYMESDHDTHSRGIYADGINGSYSD